MDTVCTWTEKLAFSSKFGQNVVLMDAKAPVGTGKAATPKELLLAAICGCTAMDVVSLMRKAKAQPTSFEISAHADLKKSEPATFTLVHLIYRLSGTLDAAVIIDAVDKSMTLYCGVSAMIAKTCPITYSIELNSREIGTGTANFPA